MKKTFITLLLASSVASAATTLKYWAANTGRDLLTVEGNNLPCLGIGDSRAPKSVADKLKTAGNKEYTLNFNVGDRAADSFAVNDAIYLNSITTTTNTIATSLSIAFGENGSITCAESIDFGTHVAGRTVDGKQTKGALTLSATLSNADLAALSRGNDVSRTLITTNYFTNTSFDDLVKNTTLTLTGSDATYAGVIYAETDNNGKITYYSAADVEKKNDGDGNTQYVSAMSTAKELVPEAGKSYIVIGANQDAGWSSMKRVSYLVTASVPEPATATLSLLALAGLAARRRRK